MTADWVCGQGGLPEQAPDNINHPSTLVTRWRAEAKQLDEISKEFDPDSIDDLGLRVSLAAMMSRRMCLLDCAFLLENRLKWSGLDDTRDQGMG